MKKSETIQNYLEAIYIISLKKDKVRAIDIVEYLHYSRPTVSVFLQELVDKKYIIIDKFNIKLTNEGEKIAKAMYERHEYIAKLLIKLGVDEEIAYEDSCMIEHDIHKETFDAIKNGTLKIVEEKKI